MKIQGVDKTLANFLKTHIYSIPRFQRPYSWEAEQIEDFWNDIIVQNQPDYFIGSIVVYSIDTETRGVVDGQQRLTTFTVLLAALRDIYVDYSFQDEADGIQQLISRRTPKGKHRFILETETSYPFLQTAIQSFPRSQTAPSPKIEEKLLSEAFLFFNKKIKETVSNQNTSMIRTELDRIRDRLLEINVVEIALDNEEDAYVAFEILNKRGKDLEVSDLVKNHILRLIPVKYHKLDTPSSNWNKIHSNVELNSEQKIKDFLYHFWRSINGDLPARMLYSGIKQNVTSSNVVKFLDQLVIESETYAKINNPNVFSWAKKYIGIKQSLYNISMFKVKLPFPLLLTLMRAHAANRITTKELRQSLFMIEYFHFAYTTLCQKRSSGGLMSMYASLAMRLNKATKAQSSKIVQELKGKLKDRLPTEGEYKSKFSTLVYSDNNPILKYSLSLVDRESREDVIVDYTQMTIEHIWPQSLKGLDNGQINNIGNLMLLAEKLNNTLSNSAPSAKIAYFIKKKIQIDKILRDNAKNWKRESIKARAALLSDLSYGVIKQAFK